MKGVCGYVLHRGGSMKRAPSNRNLWTYSRVTLLVASMLAISPAFLACGHPTTPTAAAVPAAIAGQPKYATAPPPPMDVTPFPTYPAPIYTTPVPADPNPPKKLTAVAGEVVPTPRPTPHPEDPYIVISVGDGAPDVRFDTRQATAIVLGTVKHVPPA